MPREGSRRGFLQSIRDLPKSTKDAAIGIGLSGAVHGGLAAEVMNAPERERPAVEAFEKKGVFELETYEELQEHYQNELLDRYGNILEGKYRKADMVTFWLQHEVLNGDVDAEEAASQVRRFDKAGKVFSQLKEKTGDIPDSLHQMMNEVRDPFLLAPDSDEEDGEEILHDYDPDSTKISQKLEHGSGNCVADMKAFVGLTQRVFKDAPIKLVDEYGHLSLIVTVEGTPYHVDQNKGTIDVVSSSDLLGSVIYDNIQDAYFAGVLNKPVNVGRKHTTAAYERMTAAMPVDEEAQKAFQEARKGHDGMFPIERGEKQPINPTPNPELYQTRIVQHDREPLPFDVAKAILAAEKTAGAPLSAESKQQILEEALGSSEEERAAKIQEARQARTQQLVEIASNAGIVLDKATYKKHREAAGIDEEIPEFEPSAYYRILHMLNADVLYPYVRSLDEERSEEEAQRYLREAIEAYREIAAIASTNDINLDDILERFLQRGETSVVDAMKELRTVIEEEDRLRDQEREEAVATLLAEASETGVLSDQFGHRVVVYDRGIRELIDQALEDELEITDVELTVEKDMSCLEKLPLTEEGLVSVQLDFHDVDNDELASLREYLPDHTLRELIIQLPKQSPPEGHDLSFLAGRSDYTVELERVHPSTNMAQCNEAKIGTLKIEAREGVDLSPLDPEKIGSLFIYVPLHLTDPERKRTFTEGLKNLKIERLTIDTVKEYQLEAIAANGNIKELTIGNANQLDDVVDFYTKSVNILSSMTQLEKLTIYGDGVEHNLDFSPLFSKNPNLVIETHIRGERPNVLHSVYGKAFVDPTTGKIDRSTIQEFKSK